MHPFPLLLTLLLVASSSLFAQRDSLVFKNGNYIVGELKDMDRGVLTIETDYSDSDFKIEWSGIAEIYTESSFLITLTDGRRFNGRLESTGPDTVNLLTDTGETVGTNLGDLVFLKSVDDTFASRLSASIDLGLSFTKAQNLRQLSVRSNFGYLADRWSGNLNFGYVTSNQDDVGPIRRGEGGIGFHYFLPNDWFAIVAPSFLTSTEQKLDLRVVTQAGIGKYFIHTNQLYWAFMGGLNHNYENYSADDSDRSSMEAFLTTEYNMYDLGDLSLLTRAVIYPSLTESGRWRFDFLFDAKYELPMDFYISMGLTLNYDNKPVESASTSDYVFQTSVGWEW